MHSSVAMNLVPSWAPAYPSSKARANSSGVPMPPAQTTGTPNGANSSMSSSTPLGPAWPPARRFTAINPCTPDSSPFSAPLPLGDVVVHDSTVGPDPVHHPPGLPQGRDEEPHALFQGDVDPLGHAVVVPLGGLLDEGVHPHGPVRELLDSPEPCPEVVAVDVGEADGLEDPDPSGLGDGGHELRVAAGVHGSADEGDPDPGVLGERGLHDAAAADVEEADDPGRGARRQ